MAEGGVMNWWYTIDHDGYSMLIEAPSYDEARERVDFLNGFTDCHLERAVSGWFNDRPYTLENDIEHGRVTFHWDDGRVRRAYWNRGGKGMLYPELEALS
jgi:hypothetical protein